MTLEDFFTLTEMKDGLTAPSRVRELVTTMQKERDCAVKNVGDATRQWSTVASTITATQNKDCLDLFIQLDGLWFIDRWLKDAQKFGNETKESCVEESISALLQAVEKLQIDDEKSASSGIWTTVKNLLSHSSSNVQNRAQALFGGWKQERDGNTLPQDVENRSTICEDNNNAVESGVPECSGTDISPSSGHPDEEQQIEPVQDEMVRSASSEALQLERFKDLQIQTSDETLDRPVREDGLILESVKDNIPVTEESTVCRSEVNTSVSTCVTVVSKQSISEGKLDADENTDDIKQMKSSRSSPVMSGAREISSVSSPLESRTLSSSADTAIDPEPSIEGHLENHTDAKDEDLNLKASSLDDVGTIVTDRDHEMDDIASPNQCISTRVFRTSYLAGKCENHTLQDTSGSEHVMGNRENPDTHFHKIEARGAVDKVKEHANSEGRKLKLARKARNLDVIDMRKSEDELDYGMVDAIEVARQVAIEVEREVEDRREQSCSSSERVFKGGIRQPDSPDSIDGIENQPIDGPPKEESTGPNPCGEGSLREGDPVISSENLDNELENCLQDMEFSQVTEGVQEQGGNHEKGLCDFDLNEEVCSEDMDHLGNTISTPVSVVSASRAAAVPGLPASPLQFEGALGWKGSAATSAFRPASPRRNPESDKNISVGGSSNSSKQRQDCLDFDLNVAEGGDDADLVPRKQITVSSGLRSGESSVEGSPRRSERLNLDLNRVSDDGDCWSDWRLERQVVHQQNGHRSPSPSSASSSMQPSVRNIDLNDQPYLYNNSSDQKPYLGNTSGGHNSDDSVISIMGTRVEINRKNFIPLTNGRLSEPALDLNLARNGGVVLGMGSTVPYSYSPHALGYNGLTVGSSVSFSSAIYGPGGPIPYMMDSRAHVANQIVGSASTVQSSFSQPPFIMSMTGTFPGSDEAGPSRPILDLNSGMIIDGGNTTNSGVLRQFLSPGQSRSIDEQHLRVNLQSSSSSGVGGKRKEPDDGLEPYLYNYKYQQSPWNK